MPATSCSAPIPRPRASRAIVPRRGSRTARSRGARSRWDAVRTSPRAAPGRASPPRGAAGGSRRTAPPGSRGASSARWANEYRANSSTPVRLRDALQRVELAGAYQRAARARREGTPQVELAALEHLVAARRPDARRAGAQARPHLRRRDRPHRPPDRRRLRAPRAPPERRPHASARRAPRRVRSSCTPTWSRCSTWRRRRSPGCRTRTPRCWPTSCELVASAKDADAAATPGPGARVRVGRLLARAPDVGGPRLARPARPRRSARTTASASTASGSNCVPAWRESSSRAVSRSSGSLYGRRFVIAP